MPDKRRAAGEKSTAQILREMEELSQSIESSISEVAGGRHEPPPQQPATAAPGSQKEGRGALKSLLGLFVTMGPEEGTHAAAPAEDATTPDAGTAPASGQRTGPRVSELVAGEEPPAFVVPTEAASGAGSADLAQKPFAEIYGEAGVTDSPCSVDELAKLMENPAVSNQPMSVKIIAVNLALSAKGVGVDVPVADAVRRDRALDAYQAMLAERARATEERNAALIAQLTREAEEYLKRKQAETEALRAETAEATRQSTDFALRRETEEKRLADLISPFLEGKPSPVSVGTQTGEPPKV
ncbi:MAG: hypothetical protein M3371_03180 [Acidobacteriota bacterium]|nr:hypothetical protein [Acidobacteriota bacterium]